jgi:hypothetical protein
MPFAAVAITPVYNAAIVSTGQGTLCTTDGALVDTARNHPLYEPAGVFEEANLVVVQSDAAVVAFEAHAGQLRGTWSPRATRVGPTRSLTSPAPPLQQAPTSSRGV